MDKFKDFGAMFDSFMKGFGKDEPEIHNGHNPKPYPEIPSDQWPTVRIKRASSETSQPVFSTMAPEQTETDPSASLDSALPLSRNNHP